MPEAVDVIGDQRKPLGMKAQDSTAIYTSIFIL